MDDWSQKQSGLALSTLYSSSVIPLIGLDLPGLPEIIRKYIKPMMWVHHSMLAASQFRDC
jgi:hypothetical protein